MENSQVTFAVQASGIRGPLGRPILVVCEALNHDPQQLVWLRSGVAHTTETNRYTMTEGPLTAHSLHIIEETTYAELYTALLFWKGVQAEFEALP